jgi:hypothetical protein
VLFAANKTCSGEHFSILRRLFAAVVMAIRGALAILQSAANVIGMMTR